MDGAASLDWGQVGGAHTIMVGDGDDGIGVYSSRHFATFFLFPPFRNF